MGRNKNGTVSWKMIFKDFKEHYPRLAKSAIHWRPYNQGEILIFIEGGDKMVYNYDWKQARVVHEDW